MEAGNKNGRWGKSRLIPDKLAISPNSHIARKPMDKPSADWAL
jgi:hypothetical protein